MLTSVNVHNEDGTMVLELPLYRESSEFFVKEITGLEPAPADIGTTTYVGMPGGAFQRAQIQMRNVVMKVGFNPSYSDTWDPIGTLRQELYRIFPTGKRVELHFFSTHMETVKVTGYVETVESPMFTDDLFLQVSVLCPDPHMSAAQYTRETRTNGGLISVDNGTVATGFEIKVENLVPNSQFQFVLARVTPKSETMQYNGPIFVPPDVSAFVVNTERGKKSAVWTTGGFNAGGSTTTIDILGYMENWLEIEPGANLFNILSPSGGTGNRLISITYLKKYSGL